MVDVGGLLLLFLLPLAVHGELDLRVNSAS